MDIKAYIKQHWNGELALVQSFWLNFILLSVVIKVIVVPVLYLMITPSAFILLSMILTTILTTIIFIPVYIWQAVGTWRSACKYLHANENGTLIGFGGAAKLTIILYSIIYVLPIITIITQLL